MACSLDSAKASQGALLAQEGHKRNNMTILFVIPAKAGNHESPILYRSPELIEKLRIAALMDYIFHQKSPSTELSSMTGRKFPA